MIDGEAKTVSFVTINREMAFLRFMLNMAKDDEIIEAAPKFKSRGKNTLIKSEKDGKRDRVATGEEYRGLLDNMRRPAQRDHGGGGTPLDSAEQRLRESEGRALEAIVQKLLHAG
jgi:hypothetical protein